MKKLFLLAAAAMLSFSAVADEGMWLLPYLQKMNSKDMKAKGCKLTAEEIYSINHGSLKDAIIIFGEGCTGEIVSDKGLIFTNHHCGYGSIQALSSVEHDYLKYGFWAMNNEQEIPAPGLKVRFIRAIADVTADILGNVPNIAGENERAKIIAENTKVLRKKLTKQNEGKEIVIKSFFGGNQYFSFVIEVFKDVRLVGTPPTSIGKFGGETDNWMWPRHTGDFSIFRVYADKENKPASYSPLNVPYKAAQHLKVSLDGYKEGDFAMIMGFPGTTERYMTSYEIDQLLEVENPQRIFIRGERQNILKEDMLASDKVRIQYASKYASSSNYWKNSIGKSRGIKKLNVKAQKEAQETAFQRWAEQNTLPEEKFIDALPLIKASVEGSLVADGTIQYLSEALIRAVEIISPARMVMGVVKDSLNTAKTAKLKDWLKDFYKDYNLPTDRKVAKRMFQIVQQNVKDLPCIFTEVIDVKFQGNTDAYVDYLYDNSLFSCEEKALAALDSCSAEVLKNDPAVVLARSVLSKITALQATVQSSKVQFKEGHRLYIAGLMRMQPHKAWAADANFTLRLTYGQVLPYVPADGIMYKYYTTLKGIMEKENPENPSEFTVPDKLKALYAAKDFGRYADKNGEIPVAFLANCDITGGNSGSPIMNAKGELIGLAFDGNWEAMSGDVAFEPDLQRTISVDVRYVLFVVDKFAGAGWILDEMTLVQQEK
ncbi:MAG: S46 family peptidase [Alistipes sp.]